MGFYVGRYAIFFPISAFFNDWAKISKDAVKLRKSGDSAGVGVFNSTATGVTNNHDDLRAKNIGRELKGADGFSVGKVAGVSANKDVADALIKINFRRATAVRASEDRSKRALLMTGFAKSLFVISWYKIVGNKSRVAFFEKLDSFVRAGYLYSWILILRHSACLLFALVFFLEEIKDGTHLLILYYLYN